MDRRRQRESVVLDSFWRRSSSPPRKRYIDEFRDLRNPWQKRMERKTEHNSAADASSEGHAASDQAGGGDADDRDVFGPKPLPKADMSAEKTKYGEKMKMNKGEGEAMALFVQQQKRIPRRGEIGLTSAKIEEFESSGYVMSGNRNRRMTLARLRKEAEVYSVEEKKRLEALEQEEKHLKEARMLAEMRALAAEAQRKAALAVAAAGGGGPSIPLPATNEPPR